MDLLYIANHDEAIRITNQADLANVLQKSGKSTIHILAQVMPRLKKKSYRSAIFFEKNWLYPSTFLQS